jgi:chemotaxis protein MotB
VDIEESVSLDNFENRSFDAPEDVLKYKTLIDEANKIIAGYYEGCEITQAKNFYKEVLGTASEFKLDRKFDETLIHDTTRNLKNYETEYQMKLLDFERELTDVNLKNQSLKSDSAVSENDLFFETQKKNSNSGEFVGGGDFFVSFSDIMSVLLCFFVVFFSITDQSQEAFDAFFATWPYKNDDKTIIKPNNASLSDQELKLMGKVQELVKAGISPEAIIRDDTKTIELILSNSDLFLPGKIKLSPNGSIILKEKLKDILLKGGIRQIRIEGHTDDDDFNMHQKKIKKYSTNLAFSVAHASAIAQILNKSFKFPEKLTIITGFGSKQPIKLKPLNLDKNKNSRIEIKVLQDKNIKKTT